MNVSHYDQLQGAAWEIEVRPKRLNLEGAPPLCVVFRRQGQHVATVYPTEASPGIQVVSQTLDFEHGHRGLPDGDGGQVIHEVTFMAREPIGAATVPGRWLGLVLKPDSG